MLARRLGRWPASYWLAKKLLCSLEHLFVYWYRSTSRLNLCSFLRASVINS
jgi:hypothetical protein